MKLRAMHFLVVAAMSAAGAQAQVVPGCPVFPKNNFWNTRVDNLPLHPQSAAWVANIGTSTRNLHPDWGLGSEPQYGIPWVVVPGTQPKVPITFHPGDNAADESDPGPYPFPPNIPIEGTDAAAAGEDRHAIAVDSTNCMLYETYNTFRIGGGTSFDVYSSAFFNLRSNALRPAGDTSADAAGHAVFPGLVKYDEANNDEINHAIRFTISLPRGADPAGLGGHAYMWPATHWSGSNSDPNRAPMGARFRLKQSFVINPALDPRTKAILRALKKYGLFLADGGSDWYISGTSDARWTSTILNQIKAINGQSNFEAVDSLKLRMSATSGQSVQYLPDLNLDTNADVFFRNASSGQLYRMFGNGLGFTNGAMAHVDGDTAWQIAAEGDFNGDSVRDLVWRNATTGQVYFMPFGSNGLQAAGGAVFHVEPSTNWKIAATPDIDGDSRNDLVWWNAATGQVWVMLMNGTTIKAQGMAYAEPNTQWRIVASGDFTAADGMRNQLLWRNQQTGQVFHHKITWQGGSAFGNSGTIIYTEPDTAWNIAVTGDLNADGRDDIVFRNSADGRVYGLLMGAAGPTGGAIIHQEPNLQWSIVAAGDYNGDARADLLWRNASTGQYYMMIMNGTAIAQQNFVYTEPNTSWTVLGPASYVQ